MKTAKYICERCRHYNGSGLSCVECEKGSKFVKFAVSANYKDPNKFMTPINYSFDNVRDTDISKELAMLAKNMLNDKYGYSSMNRRNVEITKVIFNDPATIVFWSDGKKTVVRTQNGDQFDPEKGLAMAISKRVLGNEGSYYEEFKRWLPEESEEVVQTTSNPFSELASRISVVDLFNHD